MCLKVSKDIARQDGPLQLLVSIVGARPDGRFFANVPKTHGALVPILSLRDSSVL